VILLNKMNHKPSPVGIPVDSTNAGNALACGNLGLFPDGQGASIHFVIRRIAMPKLIVLYIRSVAIGFGLSAVFLALMLWQDVAGLRHLIFGSDMGLVAAIMVFMFQGIVFAGVQFAIAVMMLADPDAREAVLIDPRGRDLPVLAALLSERDLRLRWVLAAFFTSTSSAAQGALF
jgi:uncharacterized membrane protein